MLTTDHICTSSVSLSLHPHILAHDGELSSGCVEKYTLDPLETSLPHYGDAMRNSGPFLHILCSIDSPNPPCGIDSAHRGQLNPVFVSNVIVEGPMTHQWVFPYVAVSHILMTVSVIWLNSLLTIPKHLWTLILTICGSFYVNLSCIMNLSMYQR